MMLFSGTTHPALAAEIAGHLGIQLSPCKISRFASGEIYFRSEESVRGADVVVAPDAGRIRTAERLREHLHADLAFLYKRRSRREAHKIEEMAVVGEVDGRPCILVDDMIDTGGTVAKGAEALAQQGAGPIYA